MMKTIKYNITGSEIDIKDLWEIIKTWMSDGQEKAKILESYYRGKNTSILSRTMCNNESDAPDNKIPISYGRKLVNTVQGYMYKPGLIQYQFDGDANKIRDLLDKIDEQVKTSIVRAYASATGYAYELHYVKNVAGIATPTFVVVPASSGFMIYDYSIEPEKIVFIYQYNQGDKIYYKAYYKNDIITYKYESTKSRLVEKNREINIYNAVPVIEHKNNFEKDSDIEVVRPLIDAYDVLMSDSMNEFDRFAWAYLLMMGAIDSDDLKNIKSRRAFTELESSDAVKFLTKDIPTDYIEFMKKWIRSEIHAQSFIPDLEEVKIGGQASGVSIDRFIYTMEYTAVDKEAYTKIALRERFNLMRNIPTLQIPDENIIMIRNTPATDDKDAEIFQKYVGHLSKRTLLESYAPAVTDVDEELRRIEEEKDEQQLELENMFRNSEKDTEQEETEPI